jgi:hypothetical protein
MANKRKPVPKTVATCKSPSETLTDLFNKYKQWAISHGIWAQEQKALMRFIETRMSMLRKTPSSTLSYKVTVMSDSKK